MPDDTPDHMAQAWVDCLRWAAGDTATLSAFHAATGGHWKALSATPANALDAMIDDATGASRDRLEAFVRWFNENVWGPMT